MRHLYVLIFICVSFCVNSSLWAQDYATGLARYLQNEFPSAESILQNLLVGEMPRPERAKILKLLGLAQYMQGKRIEAADSFKLAKQLSPGIDLKKSEILDETVVDFFNSIEGPAVTAPPPAPTPAPVEEPVETPKKKAKRIKEPEPVETSNPEPIATEVIILSNVVEGRVVIDGFFRGRIGDIIPVDPGRHTVEVYSDGYQNEVQTLVIEASRLNRFTIKLEALSGSSKTETQINSTPKVQEKPAESKANEEHKVARKKKKHRKVHSTPPPTPLYMLPFGFPQYVQGKTWMGLSFSAVQVLTLGVGVSRWLQANEVATETSSTIQSRDIQEATITDSVKRKAFADATDQYYSDQVNTINSLRTQAYLGASLFALAWLGSSLEAYLNPPLNWSVQPTYIPTSYGSGGYYALNFEFRF